MAKLLSWDPANSRHKEVATGLVLSGTSEPGTAQSGDLWLDTNDLKLMARLGGGSTILGSLVAPTFSPFDVGWTEAYWADDPDWSNPGNGNAVSSWPSRGSGARSADNGTGANQPIFRSSVAALNNRAAIDFDGSDDNLYTSTFTLTAPHNFVMIGIRDSGAWEGYVVSFVANDHGLFTRTATGNWSSYPGGYADGPSYSTGAGAAIRLFSSPSNAASFITRNGTVGSVGGGGIGPTANGISFGGARANGGFYGDCHIAFAGFYDGDVTADPSWSDFIAWVSSYYELTLA